MGRYRPPPPPRSPFITTEGAARLRAELDRLWRVERPEVTRHLAAAAAEGDRSENAEYTGRKKQLAGIDRRVRYLRKRLEALRVVDRRPDDEGRVFFGAWIRLTDEDGTESVHRIVGPDEFDTRPGYISMDAPLARALMGKRPGDEVTVKLPGGERSYTLEEIAYGERPGG